MNEFICYPEALDKLRHFGLEERVNGYFNDPENDTFISLFHNSKEIEGHFKWLRSEGYFDDVVLNARGSYLNTIGNMLNDPQLFSWKVQKQEPTQYEKEILNQKLLFPPTDFPKLGNFSDRKECGYEDIDLFSGSLPSLILNEDEFWDNQKFGFSTLNEFFGTLSAYIILKSREKCSEYNKPYSWISKRPDGSQITTEIGGDNHYDLRIRQTNLASYPTKDPFGQRVHYRPILSSDVNVMCGYHTTEQSLLLILLKYRDQQQIETSFFSDQARELIQWGESLNQRGGGTTEHITNTSRTENDFLFRNQSLYLSYDFPIPSVDSNIYNNWNISTVGGGIYKPYISEDKNLVFFYKSKNENEKYKTISFIPEDVEEAIKALIHQCAMGLGRTSSQELLSSLKYRFSSHFKSS